MKTVVDQFPGTRAITGAKRIYGVARNALILTLALVPVASYAKPAPHQAAPSVAIQCGDFSAVMQALHDKYHETPSWGGVAGRGALMLTESKDGSSWTLLLLTKRNGKDVTCILDAGTQSVHPGTAISAGGGV
jgi:hypothetical protein